MGITNEKEGKVGDSRIFSFSKNEFEIREVIDLPDIKMEWTWDSGVCPHCKRKITTTRQYEFNRIEILVDKNKNNEEAKVNNKDIVILGDSNDGRKMMFPKTQLEEVFALSTNFKNKKVSEE